MLWRCLPALLVLSAGCSSPRRVESVPAGTEGKTDGATSEPSSSGSSAGAEGASDGSGSGSGAAKTELDSEAPPPGTPLDAREPDPKRALPRLSVRHIGMHIGGDANTPESKRPFLQTLEGGEVAFLRCYRQVSVPSQGGTFGADLFIPAAGGTAEVRAVRQKLGNDDFAACMTTALGGLRFPAPVRATVVSYSLRFEVD